MDKHESLLRDAITVVKSIAVQAPVNYQPSITTTSRTAFNGSKTFLKIFSEANAPAYFEKKFYVVHFRSGLLPNRGRPMAGYVQ